MKILQVALAVAATALMTSPAWGLPGTPSSAGTALASHTVPAGPPNTTPNATDNPGSANRSDKGQENAGGGRHGGTHNSSHKGSTNDSSDQNGNENGNGNADNQGDRKGNHNGSGNGGSNQGADNQGDQSGRPSHPGRSHHGQPSDPGKSHHGQPPRTGKSHRCAPHEVAYVAAGTLVSQTLSKDGTANTYSGELQVAVRHTNRHAPPPATTTTTYKVEHVRITFALADVNHNGSVGLDDVQVNDRVKLIGKISTLAKRCAQSGFTATLTIKHIVLHPPIHMP